MTNQKEKQYLRELAKRYLEIANLPVMKERETLWHRHNALRAERPLVVMEMLSFENDLLPPLLCQSEHGQRMERTFQRAIVNHEAIDDDKVVSPAFEIPLGIRIQHFGLPRQRTFASDTKGRRIGYRDTHSIHDLETDLPNLGHSVCSYDKAGTERFLAFVQDAIGDLMPIVETNRSLDWFFGLSQHIIDLMGMQALMFAMVDTPDLVRSLYSFVADDVLMVLDWQETNGLLRPNTGNHYAGAGSFGFTTELPSGEQVQRHMLWGNLNSQETVSISPEMFHDFAYPAYERVAAGFGLTYYGCCEPVHSIWGDIANLPLLRKVSVSPWCDESFMGEALRGGNIIYSRKPSPNFIGVGERLDAEAYAHHIDETLLHARGCGLEIIHRDIYTLSGNAQKAGQAVSIIRREIDRLWQP